MPGYPQFGLGVTRSEELLKELRVDIDLAYSNLEKDRQSQYLRRCVVRAVFSYIEALIECIKVELRSNVRTGIFLVPLTEKEKEVLGALHLVGSKNDKLLPLEQNLKCTFKLAVKIWGLKGYRLATGAEDYQDFLRAKSARNRLTHPKTFYDIEVTDYDMHCHTIAGIWLQSETQRLARARVRAIADQLPVTEREALLREFSLTAKV